ncbi:MAG: response regulator transcription factor [Lachnospiraceae bacterium]|nr:response regulator transcription factor [Lachnospiraceae bacterium]
MIRIAICDDEAWCREMLREYCRNYFAQALSGYPCMPKGQGREVVIPYGYLSMPKGQGREVVMGLEYELVEFVSGEELLAVLEAAGEGRDSQASPWDILLLDIEMQGMSGLLLKEYLQKKRQEIRILFVTSHEEAMPEAFGRQVFGFLQKPLEYERFRQKMDSVLADMKDYEKYVTVENETGVRKIYLKQILYIQGYGKFTQLFLEGEASYMFSEQSLGKWRELLAEEWFCQCHKSYLVNLGQVRGMRENEIVLEGEKRIPLSRRMQKEWKEKYRKYLWEKAR